MNTGSVVFLALLFVWFFGDWFYRDGLANGFYNLASFGFWVFFFGPLWWVGWIAVAHAIIHTF